MRIQQFTLDAVELLSCSASKLLSF